ncbi:hypothetical protein SNE35_25780 [Paucibacter sp. R3-3]|uniref:Uncharacterized protein n=1 Tax=Roseateles agri TaxID=3098619 RepID=A0ABU5DNQ6_9BURK|nr:hypothetical protein [Paucibacter sp. R3-3]MDY0747938.1 hypothetical protein [Paucibacter sp. R3-3]
MAKSGATGHWTRLFGKALAFHDEIAHAAEISAEWSNDTDPGQWGARIDGLPGHMSFAWGSDSAWIYLRRPEGIWKLRIPDDAQTKTIVLWQRADSGVAFGQLFIDAPERGSGGWNWDHLSSASCADIDAEFEPTSDCPREAHEEWPAIYAVRRADGQIIVAEAGECSDGRDVDLHLRGESADWIVGVERNSGRRFALPLSQHLQASALQGKLWLRFSGNWQEAREVRVNAS